MKGDSWVSHAPLEFSTVCKMTLGVRNYFTDPLGFRTVCETMLGLRNFSHGLQKFSHSVRNDFARSTKISQEVRIDFTGVSLFSLDVRIWFTGCAKFSTPCEMI